MLPEIGRGEGARELLVVHAVVSRVPVGEHPPLAFDPVDPVATFFHELLKILDVPYLERELPRFIYAVFLGAFRWSTGTTTCRA